MRRTSGPYRPREGAAHGDFSVALVTDFGHGIASVAQSVPAGVVGPLGGAASLDAEPHPMRTTPSVCTLTTGVRAVDPSPARPEVANHGAVTHRARVLADDMSIELAEWELVTGTGHDSMVVEGCDVRTAASANVS